MLVRILEISGLVSLMIGIIGLLANFFFLDWGSTANLVFTVINLSGLVDLGVAYFLRTRDEKE